MKIRIVGVAVSLIFLAACASTPAAVPISVATTGAPAPDVTAGQQDQFIRLASRLGYHVEMVNNERHYCKTQDTTNSHLTHKECVDENQMAAKIKAGPGGQKNDLPMNGGNSASFERIGSAGIK